MTGDLIRLQSMQGDINYESSKTNELEDSQTDLFVDLDDCEEADPRDPDESANPNEPEQFAIPPERRPLHLPSSQDSPPDHILCQAELALRIKQATRYLADLRDAIAQKSFQYSHIMRSAPSKGVRTRARSTIEKISIRIGQYSRVYSRARAAMVRLGADERTLSTYKLLTRDDVKASTAILKPNIPGSSTLRLSWIWETGSGLSGSAADTMRECKTCILQFSDLN